MISFIFTAWMLYFVVLQECSPFLWWIVLAMLTSLMPVVEHIDWNFIDFRETWALLALCWVGFLALGWYFLRRYQPELAACLAEGWLREAPEADQRIAEIGEEQPVEDESTDRS